jgi:hypothetical protein
MTDELRGFSAIAYDAVSMCAQIGAADEQQRRIAVQEGQASLFDVEGWPC